MKSTGEGDHRGERSDLSVVTSDPNVLLSPLSARLAAELIALLVQQDELFAEAPRDLPAK